MDEQIGVSAQTGMRGRQDKQLLDVAGHLFDITSVTAEMTRGGTVIVDVTN